jgi:hypothetical protein
MFSNALSARLQETGNGRRRPHYRPSKPEPGPIRLRVGSRIGMSALDRGPLIRIRNRNPLQVVRLKIWLTPAWLAARDEQIILARAGCGQRRCRPLRSRWTRPGSHRGGHAVGPGASYTSPPQTPRCVCSRNDEFKRPTVTSCCRARGGQSLFGRPVDWRHGGIAFDQ